MAYEQKNNTGAVFNLTEKDIEFYKEKEWKAPQFKGSATVGNKKYWVTAFKNKAKETDKEYLGLSFKLMDSQPQINNNVKNEEPLPF